MFMYYVEIHFAKNVTELSVTRDETTLRTQQIRKSPMSGSVLRPHRIRQGRNQQKETCIVSTSGQHVARVSICTSREEDRTDIQYPQVQIHVYTRMSTWAYSGICLRVVGKSAGSSCMEKKQHHTFPQ